MSNFHEFLGTWVWLSQILTKHVLSQPFVDQLSFCLGQWVGGWVRACECLFACILCLFVFLFLFNSFVCSFVRSSFLFISLFHYLLLSLFLCFSLFLLVSPYFSLFLLVSPWLALVLCFFAALLACSPACLPARLRAWVRACVRACLPACLHLQISFAFCLSLLLCFCGLCFFGLCFFSFWFRHGMVILEEKLFFWAKQTSAAKGLQQNQCLGKSQGSGNSGAEKYLLFGPLAQSCHLVSRFRKWMIVWNLLSCAACMFELRC